MEKRLSVFFIIVFGIAAILISAPQKVSSAPPIMLPDPTDEVFLPYNISTPQWWTGVYVVSPEGNDLTVTFLFFNGDSDTPYAMVNKTLSGYTGWTGAVESLLPEGTEFLSPTNLKIIAAADFTVTQFTANYGKINPGFGFQTFYSYPVGGWPHESDDDGPILL